MRSPKVAQLSLFMPEATAEPLILTPEAGSVDLELLQPGLPKAPEMISTPQKARSSLPRPKSGSDQQPLLSSAPLVRSHALERQSSASLSSCIDTVAAEPKTSRTPRTPPTNTGQVAPLPTEAATTEQGRSANQQGSKCAVPPPSTDNGGEETQRAPLKKKKPANLPPCSYYTMKQAAAESGVSEKTIWREIQRKKLRAKKLGRQYRIADADWKAYLAPTNIGA